MKACSACSTTRTSMPRRASSMARVRPGGPAPATRTFMVALHSVNCDSVNLSSGWRRYGLPSRGEFRVTTSRKERAAETEAALKAAAKRVFAERGWVGTKITDITAAAGRAAGSFYNHFPSKEALLRALLADLLAESDEAVLDPEHSMDFTDLAAVRFHVAAYWHFYRRNL